MPLYERLRLSTDDLFSYYLYRKTNSKDIMRELGEAFRVRVRSHAVDLCNSWKELCPVKTITSSCFQNTSESRKRKGSGIMFLSG